MRRTDKRRGLAGKAARELERVRGRRAGRTRMQPPNGHGRGQWYTARAIAMPGWFEDYLACAPLGLWLPGYITASARRIGAVPRALRGVIGTVDPLREDDDAITALFVLGSFDVVVAEEVRSAASRLAAGAALIELARVRTFASMFAPRTWRRDHLMRTTADRAAWWMEFGARDLQQWVCDDPLAAVVTIGQW